MSNKNKKDKPLSCATNRRWVSIGHLSIGCILCTIGAYYSKGNLMSIQGVVAFLGAITILIEIPGVADDSTERQKRLLATRNG